MGDPALPEVFQSFFSGLEEERWPSRPDNFFRQCFGCGPDRRDGLRVRCFRTPEGVASPILIARQFEGPPGAAHGGIVAAYLDEVLGGAVVRATGQMGVTGELTVRYVAPVPIETPIVGLGALVADHGRYVDVEGRLEDLQTRRLLATARGRFFPVKS